MLLRNARRFSSGQTSLEVLFIVAFVIVFTMGISLPYVTNQTKTNVSIQTKLAIFPLIEKNTQLVHIATILPIVNDTSLSMTVNTRGQWNSTMTPSEYCSHVCPLIDPDHYYTSTTLEWAHNESPFCSTSC